MSNAIHPTAFIGQQAKLGDGNEIGPGCVVDGAVALGSNNKLWMNVYVGPGTTMGDGNQIHMGAVIGHMPQDLTYAGETTQTAIGSRNTIREYVTIHRGTKGGGTTVGDDNFLMANAHIAHDCHVGSRTVFANLATLAGHCEVDDGAVLSGMIVVHQFVRIGKLAMVSGLSAVNKDVPPYLLCAGRPAVIRGINAVGMRRGGLSPEVRQEIKRAYALLYREGLNVPHAVEAIAKECRSAELQEFVAFVKASKRGISAGLPARQAGIGAEVENESESLLPKKPAQDAAKARN